MSESKTKQLELIKQMQDYNSLVNTAADFLQKYQNNNSMIQALNKLNESIFWFNHFILNHGKLNSKEPENNEKVEIKETIN